MKFIPFMFVIGLIFLATGCVSGSLLEKDPRCPFSERGGCHSVKTINKMIDENRYTPDGNFLQAPQPMAKLCIKSRKKMQVFIPEFDKSGTPINARVKIIEVES